MSARKRKAPAEVDRVFQSIQDKLILIKPRLSDPKRSAPDVLVEQLDSLAALARDIASQRPRADQADSLDREGVNLWNASNALKSAEGPAGRGVVAALRLAGFRLIEAGLQQKQPIETLVHVLQLASKAGTSLSEAARHDDAASVLACAAKYEEQLRATDDGDETHQQAKGQAVILYYSSRMEAAWREGNRGVADFMLQKITEHDQRLRLLPPRDRVSLATKLLEIGKSILKSVGDAPPNPDGAPQLNAVKWMQKAFTVIDLSDDTTAPGIRDLKRSILRGLARAYYMSSSHDVDNLDRAEAALNELIDTIEADADGENPEHQQLRWMRVAILKRRKAAEVELLDAFKSIIDHMSCSDSSVTDILQEMRTLTPYHTLVTSVHQHALQKVVDSENTVGGPYVDRLLLSLLFHCARDENHARAMQDVEAALTCLNNTELQLPKVPATACLTLLWQFGDRHYTAKRWAEAADWFMCGTNPVFTSMARASHAKCFRKAALCHIQQEEYAQASSILRRCPGSDAATRYVVLLAAAHQGLEDEAIRAVQDMVGAPDFDRKMLLLATQLANECNMKTLLLAVLEALLESVQNQNSQELHMEALTLIRCIIRLVVKLMAEPGADSAVLVRTLIGHFITAKTLVESFPNTQRAAVAQDVSWLWRSAYNCAVQGCADWKDDEAVSAAFDISRELLELYCASSLADVDADLHLYIANASFASVAGRVFRLRQRQIEGAEVHTLLETIFKDLGSCKDRIQRLLDRKLLVTEDGARRAQTFIHVLRLFSAELCCLAKDWKRLLDIVKESVQSDPLATNTFEALSDMLWVEKECPVEVLFTALEAILHASLDHSTLSVEKFSRWLRAICTILLARNSPSDRTKALQYVEQAVAVMEEHSEDPPNENTYPMDERQWLLGTSYNTGIECLHASMADEAKRWFESATVICRFVPDGEARAAKISESYTHLLSRYLPGAEKSTDSEPS